LSGVINIFALTSSLFMMQVYDRVLASKSVPTLLSLAVLAILAYIFQGGLDIIRSRVLTLIGEKVDAEAGPLVHAAMLELPLKLSRCSVETSQPLRDLATVRSFLGGSGLAAFFDVPWTPLYLTVAFLLHPDLGLLTTFGAAVLMLLTALTEWHGKGPLKHALETLSVRNRTAEEAQQAAEVIRGMGLRARFQTRWLDAHHRHLVAQRRANFIIGFLTSLSKMFRMILQSAVLGLGAYLAVRGQISSGSIIACSILSSRALAPIDQVIASWKGFVAARQSYSRLTKLLAQFPPEENRFALATPTSSLAAENLMVGAPGQQKRILNGISFELRAGDALGIIGASASGKSTLARALVGVWSTLAGRVLLDGASISQWNDEALNSSIGYLPQDVQLLEGTIAENISRFEDAPDPSDVAAAAYAAGFHHHILSFPNGYDTRVGVAGCHLSAGQRQMLGLARAVYRNPFLVVLDEPNSNLDAEGEASLTKAIDGIRARQGIAVIIAHRKSALAAVNMLLVLRNGATVDFGCKEDVLRRLQPQLPKTPTSLLAATG
jgi:ATP-binding cassette subfamily C protein